MGLPLQTKRLNDPRSSVQLVAGMEPPPPGQNHLSKVEEGEGQGLKEPRESLHYTHTHTLSHSLYVYTLNPSIIYIYMYNFFIIYIYIYNIIYIT